MSIVAYDMSVKGKRVTYKSIPIVSICDLLNNNKIGNEGNVFRPRQKVIQCDGSLAAFFLLAWRTREHTVSRLPLENE